MVKPVIFPLQQLMNGASRPLVEADNGPQTAPDCTAAAQAAAKKPLHIDGQVLLQASVHPADAGFEFLWRYLSRENRGEFCVKSVA